MKALNALIKQENAWTSMFNGRFVAYEVATVAGRKRVAEMIDCKLSCDRAAEGVADQNYRLGHFQ